MQSTDELLIKEACDLATQNVELGGGPFGCVITDANYNIIGRGQNRVTLNNNPTLHAEMVAIENACKNINSFNLSDCRLYTSCEPCPMCLSAIYWSRLTTVFYGNSKTDASNIGFDDSFIYDEINKPINERKIQMTQIHEHYAKESFENWAKYEKKIEY
jgi:tRNA(Arg) A34 adenosine deaminase TadA